MNPVIQENKVENNLTQQKVDENVVKNNFENTTQNNISDTKPEEQIEADENFKTFREGRKKDRLAREEAERRAAEKEAEVTALKAAMEAAFTNSAPKYPQSQNNFYGMPGVYQQEETEEQKLENKIQSILAAREAEAEKIRIEREKREYPQKLVQTFPDFNQVITQENLDYLDYHHPEISRALQRQQDGYEKWADVYQIIKKFIPNNTTSRKDAEKVQSNLMKPKSISSTGITQTQQARESSQEIESRRAANWSRMQKIMNGLS